MTGTTLLQTERHGELITVLPIAVKQAPRQHMAIYELTTADLTAGDLVRVTARFEATNPHAYNVMLGSYLKVTPGQYVHPCYPATGNITPDMHHWTRVEVGTHRVTVPGAHVFGLYAYAAASRATAGDALQIERGYGGLTLEIVTP